MGSWGEKKFLTGLGVILEKTKSLTGLGVILEKVRSLTGLGVILGKKIISSTRATQPSKTSPRCTRHSKLSKPIWVLLMGKRQGSGTRVPQGSCEGEQQACEQKLIASPVGATIASSVFSHFTCHFSALFSAFLLVNKPASQTRSQIYYKDIFKKKQII